MRKAQRRRQVDDKVREQNEKNCKAWYTDEPEDVLHVRLKAAAAAGFELETRWLVEHLIRVRGQAPTIEMYNALILSNTDPQFGAAWRVIDLLGEMRTMGFTPDVHTCHAVLKVTSIHLDHLLRSDFLEYMRSKWIPLSAEGAHDVAAGLFREAQFEKGLERISMMRSEGMNIEGWLLDLANYMLCDAGEIVEAYKLGRSREDSLQNPVSKNVWYALLDHGSQARHHASAAWLWSTQVSPGYINPSSGMCLNVLATASKVGDATLGTDVFAHLGKQGTPFQRTHFELLATTYLAASPPDLRRALHVLTIMSNETFEPTSAETRSLYLYLKDKPAVLEEVMQIIDSLHQQGRNIPIAIFNVVIECYVAQNDLDSAMKVYKLIHTFTPIGGGIQKCAANIETFNILLKGCRTSKPPNAKQAVFIVSELLSLRVKPTSLTFDRLILVLVESALNMRQSGDLSAKDGQGSQSKDLLDWSYRHFTDMQTQKWVPRFGTVEKLATELARVGDARCWDVVQHAEDSADQIGGLRQKAKQLRLGVEAAWLVSQGHIQSVQQHVGHIKKPRGNPGLKRLQLQDSDGEGEPDDELAEVASRTET
jgi:pentatricopeptide repeat protein